MIGEEFGVRGSLDGRDVLPQTLPATASALAYSKHARRTDLVLEPAPSESLETSLSRLEQLDETQLTLGKQTKLHVGSRAQAAKIGRALSVR